MMSLMVFTISAVSACRTHDITDVLKSLIFKNHLIEDDVMTRYHSEYFDAFSVP